MRYTLNEYLPHLQDSCTRLEICPNKDFSVELVSEYMIRGAEIVPLYDLLSDDLDFVPDPDSVINKLYEYSMGKKGITVYVGIEAYLLFLSDQEQKDFFIGIRSILDSQGINSRFVVTKRFSSTITTWNPKYEDSLALVFFAGEYCAEFSLNIMLFQDKWLNQESGKMILRQALIQLGNYEPQGEYKFCVRNGHFPKRTIGFVTIVNNATKALNLLYGIDYPCNEKTSDYLLCECAQKKKTPRVLLNECFGEDNINLQNAPRRLNELKDDPLWEMYVWLIKTRISSESYLYRVLNNDITPESFWKCYVIDTAIQCLGNKNARSLAEERAKVLILNNSDEALIAQFVYSTAEDYRAVPFYNCGKKVELQGLITQASKYDLGNGLPKMFDQSNELLSYYISPFFDYGEPELTSYFHRVREFRVKNDITDDFVKQAYCSNVPSGIEKRDSLLAEYDDGQTALFVVDGLGAEYLPLLIKLAYKNGVAIARKEVAAANLPTSTEFNNIVWNDDANRIQEAKQIDNISHVGSSKYEHCRHEENLAEVLLLFPDTIIPRVIEGLKRFKRVVVTGDHGSSYLAVCAYRKGMAVTIDWDNPDDWRYTKVPNSLQAPESLEPVYYPKTNCSYFVTKGYNRLSKKGGKLYALHGGASLEERLVPFIVFTQESVEEKIEIEEDQFIEDSVFDELF